MRLDLGRKGIDNHLECGWTKARMKLLKHDRGFRDAFPYISRTEPAAVYNERKKGRE